MAEKEKDKKPVKARANAVEVDEHAIIQGTAKDGRKLKPINHVGAKRRDSGPMILKQVFVNCIVGRENRRSNDCLALHEIPLMRAKLRRSGGTVEILATFAPGLSQVRGLTKQQLADELIRLYGNEKPEDGPTGAGKYVIPDMEGQRVDIFHAVYREDADLFKAIERSHAKWLEVVARAENAMRRLAVADIEECVKVCLPPTAINALDAYKPMTETVAAKVPRTGVIDHVLVEYLAEQEIPDTIANSFAKAIATHGWPLNPKQWAKVDGVGKDEDKQRTLTERYQTFMSMQPA